MEEVKDNVLSLRDAEELNRLYNCGYPPMRMYYV